ncbi:MAG: hypothetical protein Q4D03_08175 [Bacteroidales bacterium]|nr:hypothetical protein [Bacteroidales bacterium]
MSSLLETAMKALQSKGNGNMMGNLSKMAGQMMGGKGNINLQEMALKLGNGKNADGMVKNLQEALGKLKGLIPGNLMSQASGLVGNLNLAQSEDNDKAISDTLEQMINAVAADGVVTDQERALVKAAAQQAGIDPELMDALIDAKLKG